MRSPFDAFEEELNRDDHDDPDGVERSSWAAVDLGDALAGVDVPGPSMLARTDDVRLVYRGRTHQFAGESESCKTWAALLCVKQTLDEGGTVLWIDFEDDDRGIVARLLSLGVDRSAIAEQFVYVRPDEPLHDRSGRATAGNVAFGAVLASRAFDLAVVDGVTEAMTTEGLDLMSNADIATWSRRVPKRIVDATGAGVIVIDHVTKSTEGRGRFAIGGQHKLSGLTGAAYVFDVTKRLSRSTNGEESTGSVRISVAKDRPGHVRGNARGDVIGVLELVAYPDGGLTAKIVPAGESSTVPDIHLLSKIGNFLSVYDGASKNKIIGEVEGKTDSVRNAVQWMVDNLWLSVTKSGQSHRHHLTDLGRKELGL
ncbi:MAG: AAA family ATPase [Ilumatobacteraceae bacterium]